MKQTAALIGAGALLGSGLIAVTATSAAASPARVTHTARAAGVERAAVAQSVASPATATRTLGVPSPYRSINSAVAAAHSGDTVLVQPGTYRETVHVDRKYVVIRAASSDPSRTTITGVGGRSAVEFTNVPRRSLGPRAGLFGFRIANTHTVNGLGGGVSMKARADAQVERNLIENNSTSYGGGLLIFDHSNPLVRFNVIRNNRATYGGAGLFSAASSSPQIYGNTITGNISTGANIPGGGPAGAAMYVTGIGASTNDSRCYPSIVKNSISGNSASFAGGGLYFGVSANAVVARNHIFANSSAYGGGIHIEDHGASVTVSINVIEGNSATRKAQYSGSGSGGGISVFGGSRPGIGHNSINYNKATYAGGGIVIAESSNAVVTGNRMYANQVNGQVSGAAGGGIFVAQATALVENNLLRSNSAKYGNGGGVAALGTGAFQLVNNVLVYNTASRLRDRAFAGGLYVGSKPANQTSINNNIITGNGSYQVAESAPIANYGNNLITNSDLGMFFSYSAHTLTSSTQFNGNGHVHYAQGNISTAPRFVNGPAGDVRLVKGSPGINEGRRTGGAVYDVNGVRRPVGSTTDIGMYEQ